MRLFIFSMPAVAIVAILSVSLQHSLSNRKDLENQAALPEATRIFLKQTQGREGHSYGRVRALAQGRKRGTYCYR